MTSKSTLPPPGSPRLNRRELADLLGEPVSQQFRRNNPSSYPRRGFNGTYDEAEALAYKKLRDVRANISAPTAPPPVATAPAQDRRATTTDRRTPNV